MTNLKVIKTSTAVILAIACMIFLFYFLRPDSRPAMSWLYQLQNINPDRIIQSGFRTVVIDYSPDGTEKNKFKAADIERIKSASVIPVAYVSIGEAEKYRYYWRPDWKEGNPEWLGRKNPEFGDNYKVKYWYPEWQRLIKGYLDKIFQQGFAGVYLDIVDGFEYWSNPESHEQCLSEAEAAEKMIEFVITIANYSRKRAGRQFLIIPQNGERLLDYDLGGRYLDAISGIGVEDTWYDRTIRQHRKNTEEKLFYLRKFVKSGKAVFAVDYVDDGSGYRHENKKRMERYVKKCVKNGFHYYIAKSDRNLDSINIIDEVQLFYKLRLK